MSDSRTIEERFWARVATTSDIDACWPWTGGVDKDGYGKFDDGRAHIYAFVRVNGSVPRGKLVCHSCDTPGCCNDNHLWVGTPLENMQDKVHKGRFRAGRGERHGHAKLTDDQVIVIRSRTQENQRLLGLEFGVSQGIISMVINRKIWNHI